MARKDRARDYAALGVICGLGLLAKATFLPFTVVLAGFSAYRLWEVRGDRSAAWRRLLGIVTMVVTLAAIAGWWYLDQLRETGNLIGAKDLTNLDRAGGLAAIVQRPNALTLVIKDLLQIGLSFVWSSACHLSSRPKQPSCRCWESR